MLSTPLALAMWCVVSEDQKMPYKVCLPNAMYLGLKAKLSDERYSALLPVFFCFNLKMHCLVFKGAPLHQVALYWAA